MKIGPSNVQAFSHESAKPTKPTKITGSGEQKAVPPGLERAQARLQSVPAADRNHGQATAADRISRNIARYAETQAIVPPPVTAPVTPPTLPTAPTGSTSPTPADSTPSTPTPETSTSTTAEAVTTGSDTTTV